ncbi:MAG TPA: molybdopterin cofactor-binding domain-containing protein, partial [Tepidisphaeraceae bacterium]|nr:molybdopterin cofactor-binding domain-containing protein [Tepidisphaeraceae bacterium]
MAKRKTPEDEGPSGPEIPTWGPKNKHRLLNTKMERVDAPFKTSGTAYYTYDIRLPGMLFGRLLLCPHAKATIKSIDLKPALAIPGVKAAIEWGVKNLAFQGAPVAAVAATTPEIADDAIHAITVEYDVLPHAVTAEESMASNAPPVFFSDDESNTEVYEEYGDPNAAASALSHADAVVEATYTVAKQHHVCLEAHGVVVDYRGGDSAVVYHSTQNIFAAPRDIAPALGINRTDVTVITQHMGGGFGSKGGAGFEGISAARLSKIAGAPVKMMMRRPQVFVGAGNRPNSIQTIKAGANKDGSLVALSAVQYNMSGIGGQQTQGQPYVYKIPEANVYRKRVHVFTNEDAGRPMRGPSHPEASFAMDSMMDELAFKIGMDPVEFRKKNILAPDADPNNPQAAGHIRQLTRGAAEIGWERRNKTPGAGPGPLKRGMGCGVGHWGGGGGPHNVVTVTITPDAAVAVKDGAEDLGTGTRTYFRAIVAEDLGLEMDQVKEMLGNTSYGKSGGSGGSTMAPSLASATKMAVYNAKTEMAKRVAPLLGAKPEDVVFADGMVSGGGKSMTFKQACAALPSAGLVVQGTFRRWLSGSQTHGVCFAEVEVDVETGHIQPIKLVHVQDMGLPLNRLAVESQINGGMIQG